MSQDITIKLHVASVTEHGAGGGHEATLLRAADERNKPLEISALTIHSTDKLIELGYYEMTLRKVE